MNVCSNDNRMAMDMCAAITSSLEALNLDLDIKDFQKRVIEQYSKGNDCFCENVTRSWVSDSDADHECHFAEDAEFESYTRPYIRDSDSE